MADLDSLLARCGVHDPGVLPFSTKCALCQTEGLTVNGRNGFYCKNCNFIGDCYEYYAKFKKTDLETAINELILDNVIHWDGDEKEGYLADRRFNRACLDALERGRTRLTGGSPAVAECLQGMEVYFNIQQLPRLAKYLSTLRQTDFDEQVVDHKAIKAMRQYTILSIPCFNQSTVIGFWGINTRCFDRGVHYFQLASEHEGYGFIQAVGLQHETTFVVNDPRVALRFMARQTIDESDPIPYVCPAALSTLDTTVHIPSRDVVYFPCMSEGDTAYRWYGRAIHFLGNARTVPDWELGFVPLTQWPAGRQTSQSIARFLKTISLPAHQALGRYLLRKPKLEAARHASAMTVPLPDQQQVLSYFSDEDALHLKRIFEVEQKQVSVEIDGNRVVETPNGWFCDEKMISEAVLRIKKLLTTNGESTVAGSVSFLEPGTRHVRVEHFTENLETIEANPALWLRRFVRSKGGWAEVNDRWSKKLIAIAKKFSVENLIVVNTNQTYGWSDQVLRFPRFSVDKTGIHRAIHPVVGPDIAFPTPLTVPEQDAFANQDFCLVFLALLGNLYRTAQGKEPVSLLFNNAPHCVDQIAEVFGTQSQRNISATTVAKNIHPIPMFVNYTDHEITEVIRLRKHHLVTSIDSQSFKLLAADQSWLRLPVTNMADYSSLRWVFQALALLLASNVDGSFHSIAKFLQRPSSRLQAAGSELDNNWYLGENGTGTQTVRLLHYLHTTGALPTTLSVEGVEITHADLIKAMAAPYLPPVDIQRLVKQMISAKMLSAVKPDRLVVNTTLWSLVGSFN